MESESGPSVWLKEAQRDLNAAKILYENKLYPQALFHLQQSNEKIAKGLLLSLGILSEKLTKGSWATKSLVGFLPKTPKDYGHRTLPSLTADFEKFIPIIKSAMSGVPIDDEFKPKFDVFRKAVDRSAKSLATLRLRTPRLIDSDQELDKELVAATLIVDGIDEFATQVGNRAKKMDGRLVVDSYVRAVRRTGRRISSSDLPSVSGLLEDIGPVFKLILVVTVSVALSGFLDPLVSVSRYPISGAKPIDDGHPYVIRFQQLQEVIGRCLKLANQVGDVGQSQNPLPRH